MFDMWLVSCLQKLQQFTDEDTIELGYNVMKGTEHFVSL
jgi:hypothetical protein